jgi:hypothetical protein
LPHVVGFRVHGRKGMRIGPTIAKDTLNPVTITEAQSSYNLRDGYKINLRETLVHFYNRRFPRERTKAELLKGATSSIFVTDGSNQLDIHFKRAPRVPEDGNVYQLPPPMENFPLLSAHAFEKTLPDSMRVKGGLFFPMFQREALLLAFTSQYSNKNQFAIRVFAGSINAVSGTAAGTSSAAGQQDYLITPSQQILSGFCFEVNESKQFVAMPIGDGYTLEKQITGEELIGGIQLEIAPRYRDTALFGRLTLDPQTKVEPRHLECALIGLFSSPEKLGLRAGQQIFMKDYGDDDLYDFNMNYSLDLQVYPELNKLSRPTFVHELFDGPWSGKYGTSSSLLIEPITPITLYVDINSNGSKLKDFTLKCSQLATLSDVKKAIVEFRLKYKPDFLSIEINGQRHGDEDLILDDLCLGTSAKVSVQSEGVAMRPRFAAGGADIPRIFDAIYTPGWEIGLSAGGSVKQGLVQDTNPEIWDWESSRLINVQILNTVTFRAVTGLHPPLTPISFDFYRSSIIQRGLSKHIAGKAWSMVNNEPLKSVEKLDAEKQISFDVVLTEGKLTGCVCCESRLCDSM